MKGDIHPKIYFRQIYKKLYGRKAFCPHKLHTQNMLFFQKKN